MFAISLAGLPCWAGCQCTPGSTSGWACDRHCLRPTMRSRCCCSSLRQVVFFVSPLPVLISTTRVRGRRLRGAEPGRRACRAAQAARGQRLDTNPCTSASTTRTRRHQNASRAWPGPALTDMNILLNLTDEEVPPDAPSATRSSPSWPGSKLSDWRQRRDRKDLHVRELLRDHCLRECARPRTSRITTGTSQ